MDLDFALILTVATLVAGLICLADKFHFRQHERMLAAARQGQTVREHIVIEYAWSFFPVLAVVWVLRSFLVEPFTIPSGSMLPTLEVGDYILVNKYAYGLRLPVLGTEIVPIGKPQRGDIMVFKYPENPSMNFIKRVVGLPGDRIRTEANGDLFVNGQLVARTLIRQEPQVDPWEFYYDETLGTRTHVMRLEAGNEGKRKRVDTQVPPGYYFMMGDNRDNSNDSRYWGPVPEKNIVGKAFFIWMHKDPGLHLPYFSRDGVLHH